MVRDSFNSKKTAPPTLPKRYFQKNIPLPKASHYKPSEVEASKNELRRRKLCFICRETWQPRHRCLGKGQIHYIEVVSDEEMQSDEVEPEKEVEEMEHEHQAKGYSRGTLAALTWTPLYNVFRIRGILKGWKVTILINSGATYNYINEEVVNRLGLKAEEFEGFDVKFASGTILPCTKKIPQM